MSRAFANSGLAFQSNRAGQGGFVHCPVCQASYSCEETESHLMRHQLWQMGEQKKAQLEHTSVSSSSSVAYPMIEPLEFDTSRFKSTANRSTFSIEKQEKNKKEAKIIEMIDRQTQTVNRPLLQQRNDERDLYNCFDDFFNGGNISYEDVVGKNVGLASKRQLTQWEQARIYK